MSGTNVIDFWPFLFWGFLNFHGLFVFMRIRKARNHTSAAHKLSDVEIIVPARNEEKNLQILLSSLQEIYPNVKVTVVNDGSTDATAEVVKSFGINCLDASALKDGWTGKNWACHLGGSLATQEVLLFIDADVQLLKGSIEKAIAVLSSSSPLISAIPIHEQSRWYTRFFLGFWLYVFLGSESLKNSFCIGQFMMMERDWYNSIGGHEAVKGTMAEDLSFQQLVFKQKKRYRLLGPGVFTVNMYPDGFASFAQGWTRLFQSAQTRLSFFIFLCISGYVFALGESIKQAINGNWLLFFLQIGIHVVMFSFLRLRMTNLVFVPLSLGLFVYLNFLALLKNVFLKRKMDWKGRTFVEKF